MIVLQWSKTQLLALFLLAYVGIVYIIEGNRLDKITRKSSCNAIYSALYITTEIAVLFDGITACTINYWDKIPVIVNLILHFIMFAAYEIFVALLFWYWIYVTVGIPKKPWVKAACIIPSVVSVGLTALFISDLDCIHGEYTNYSMGTSVYVCFITIAIYCVLILAVFVKNNDYLQEKKRNSIYTSCFFIIILLTIQVIFPEYLISCMAATMVTISIYINMEIPSLHELEHYHYEMVMGFAILVENKDDNTGGHIRRSSAYARLIAKKLQKNKKFKNIITKDYLNDLDQSAPMHDIGKIGIPDAILQKPGRLTEEEFAKMKEHPVIGGKIIRNTFGHLYDGEYENMAYQVAMYHHEKWNGKGYPEGLKGEEIPLCARIMAVADVFDAVSAKRCYRDAMPLEECYNIIMKGRNEDFDPEIVDVFMMNKDKVEEIYNSENHD